LNADLAQKEADLEILTTRLASLISTKEQKERESNQLKADLASLQSKIDRGEKLVSGLADEKTRWDTQVKELDFNFNNLIGDCLLSAAFMSYCGPFPSDFRNLLNKEWLRKIKEE
jgi:dynein heavy chain